MDNEIVIKEDELENVSESLSNSFINVANTGEAINPQFSGAVNVGLLGNSIGVVSNQMGAISRSINNVQGIIEEYSYEMTSYDKNMANKIEEIEIPQDFLANDSSVINTYTQALVGKLDGYSVNDGQNVNKINDIAESSISATSLGDITGNNITTQSYDDTSLIDKEDNMNDITKVSNMEPKLYDDESSIEEHFMLIDMIERGPYEEAVYDDSLSIEEQEIYDMSDGQTEVQKYDDTSSVEAVQLNDMSNYVSAIPNVEAEYFNKE